MDPSALEILYEDNHLLAGLQTRTAAHDGDPGRRELAAPHGQGMG